MSRRVKVLWTIGLVIFMLIGAAWTNFAFESHDLAMVLSLGLGVVVGRLLFMVWAT